MVNSNRRRFLKRAGALVSAVPLACGTRASRAAGANERIVVGVIGCGGRGTGLAKIFSQQPDAEVAYVCDPDQRRVERARQAASATHAVADMRRIFDDKSVDAVVIATCDHWHTPAALLAAQTGKRVYVGKALLAQCARGPAAGRGGL